MKKAGHESAFLIAYILLLLIIGPI